MNFENMNIWCWLIPLLIGVICGILGYFWGKGSDETIDHSAEIKTLREKNAKLQSDLDLCNKKLVATPSPKAVAFDANAAKAAFGKTVKEDDLKMVEGIGPKIEEMFQAAGIKTWRALSEISVARCQEIVDKGGERYKVHKPASWPMQAKMCYEGKWAALKKWQDEHNNGEL